MKSMDFLSQVCQNFVKQEFLKDVAGPIDFSQKDIQKDTNDIFLGSECEEYLKDVVTKGHIDAVAIIRQNCLQFYKTAAEQIRKRFPISDRFLIALQVFGPNLIFNEDRETSFRSVSFVARTLGGFDEEHLKKEWIALPADFTLEKKEKLLTLNFDEMWKEILLSQSSNNDIKYPSLRNLVNAVRALPNSNADPERTFSILTDLKSKRRNSLSSTCVDAVCVIKSALNTRGETALNMTITEKHISRMSSDILYAASQSGVVDDVRPSSSTQ